MAMTEHLSECPETSSCIKPSTVKGQGWSNIKYHFFPQHQMMDFTHQAYKTQRKWNQSPIFKEICKRLENEDGSNSLHIPSPSPAPPPPPPPPPRFPGFVDTVARVVADKSGFEYMKGVNLESHLPCEPSKQTQVTAKSVNADSDCLISIPQRAFDFSPNVACGPSEKFTLRSNCSNSARHLPPRTSERELQIGNAIHKAQFAKTGEFLFHLYEHDQLTDVIVHCGGYTFSAHAVTLACHSSFFCRSLLDSRAHDDNYRHVALTSDVSPTAFHVLLDYMYTGDLPIDTENVAELLSAAVTLGMESVEKRCSTELHTLTPENVLVVWEMAERSGLEATAQNAIKIIGENVHVVIKSAHFLSLDVTTVTKLLSRDDLPVTSEYEVGDAAISWLCFNVAERRPYIARLMSCVRLSLMTPTELFRLINKAEFLFKDEDVQNMFMVANWLATGRQLDLPTGLRKYLPSKRRMGKQSSPKNSDVSEGEQQAFSNEKVRGSSTSSNARVMFVDPTLDDENSSTDTSVDKAADVDSVPPVTVKRLMLLGGYDPVAHGTDNYAVKTMTYNRAAHAWMSHTDMPQPRAHHASVIFNNTIFVIGGSDPLVTCDGSLVPQKTVFAFSIEKGDWYQRAPLNTPRTRHCTTVLDGKIYVIGGRDDKGVLASVERYDMDSDLWESVTPMTCPRLGAGVAAYCNKLVVTGGYGPSPGGHHSILSSVEFYDTTEKKWTLMTPLRKPRCHGSLVEYRGAMYLCGGLTSLGSSPSKLPTASLADVDIYCGETDAWALLAQMALPRHQAAATVLDGELYIVGGMSTKTGTTCNAVECYDINTGTWEIDVKPLPRPLVGCELISVDLLF